MQEPRGASESVFDAYENSEALAASIVKNKRLSRDVPLTGVTES